MPELPEVEIIRAGISAFVTQRPINSVLTYGNLKLRVPIPSYLQSKLYKQSFSCVKRCGKYLLLCTSCGTLILHFGMSGKLRILPKEYPKFKHEHLTIVFCDGMSLRFIDSRRFGLILWTDGDPYKNPILANLGCEPLSDEFNSKQFFNATRKRKTAIKRLLMDGKVVAGVGNIYANEALFLAKIHPNRKAFLLSYSECCTLVAEIKNILLDAIACGGSTISDFVDSDGSKGSFQYKFRVYGRGGQKCLSCGNILTDIRLGQRSTVYCSKCQI